ncbi:MAG: phosphotransferase [Planctomycetota bacterium]
MMPPADLLDALLAGQIAAALPTARWFAGKRSVIDRVTIHDRVALPGFDEVALTLVDVVVEGSDVPHRYVAPVAANGGDAASSAAFARWLLDSVVHERTLSGRSGGFVGHCETAGLAVADGAMTVAPLGGDASNSSFVVRCDSHAWAVKLFRRCRASIQPEVEIGRFFAQDSPWGSTPRLVGWLEYAVAETAVVTAGDVTPHAVTSTAIATVHEFLPDCTTGWDRLVGLVLGDGRVSEQVLEIVAALGRLTGAMHRALAARPDILAFAPEPATAASRAATAARMREHAAGVFSLIESRRFHCEPTIAGRLEAVLATRERLLESFDQITSVAVPMSKIRVHGDYHLGQVLVQDHGERVFVIDFEGEPSRTLAERREKTFAAKDVAGMCRSLDYLLRHVAKTTGRPYLIADLLRLETCYLDAYREVAAGQPWWPADRQAADSLLAAFKLDKSIYELAYELTYRPDWIDVPLAAVEEAAATGAPCRG